jgi:integrase
MATVQKRTWLSRGPTGHKVRKVAYGYTLQVNGKQERRCYAEWRTRDDARQALARRLLELDAPQPPPEPPPPKTFAVVAEEYVALKRAKGKRSIHDDELILKRLKAWFGEATPIVDVTAQRIAQYERDRLSKMSVRGTPLAAATLNRELALVRHLLRLAEEWGYIQKIPRVRLAKEPEGRLRFLTEDEIARLLAAAAESQNTYFLTIVTIALNTGMRKNEILKLAWERVDFSRAPACRDEERPAPRGADEPSGLRRALELARREGGRAGLPPARRCGLGRCPHRVRARLQACEDHGLSFPRPPPHLRVMADHARPKPQGGAGDPRPSRVQHDAAVRSPQP